MIVCRGERRELVAMLSIAVVSGRTHFFSKWLKEGVETGHGACYDAVVELDLCESRCVRPV